MVSARCSVQAREKNTQSALKSADRESGGGPIIAASVSDSAGRFRRASLPVVVNFTQMHNNFSQLRRLQKGACCRAIYRIVVVLVARSMEEQRQPLKQMKGICRRLLTLRPRDQWKSIALKDDIQAGGQAAPPFLPLLCFPFHSFLSPWPLIRWNSNVAATACRMVRARNWSSSSHRWPSLHEASPTIPLAATNTGRGSSVAPSAAIDR